MIWTWVVPSSIFNSHTVDHNVVIARIALPGAVRDRIARFKTHHRHIIRREVVVAIDKNRSIALGEGPVVPNCADGHGSEPFSRSSLHVCKPSTIASTAKLLLDSSDWICHRDVESLGVDPHPLGLLFSDRFPARIGGPQYDQCCGHEEDAGSQKGEMETSIPGGGPNRTNLKSPSSPVGRDEWSSHNPKVGGSNPPPATKESAGQGLSSGPALLLPAGLRETTVAEQGQRLETIRIDDDGINLAAAVAAAGEVPEVVLEATCGYY